MTTSISTGLWLQQLNAELEGSDRACAVLAGAILDDRLRQLLLKFMVPPANSREDKLFGRFGALESFSSRIEVARRLNLLAVDVTRSLDWIREIRNDAAHEEHFSFDDDGIRDRVNNVLVALELRARGPGLFREPYTAPKGHFIIATAMLALRIDIEEQTLAGAAHQPLENASISIGA